MPQDILGSKMKTFPQAPGARERATGYGQNGFSGASSLLPGEKVDRSPIMQGIAQPDPDLKSVQSWQTRTISAKPIKATPTMKRQQGALGTLPNTTSRGTVVKPAPRGDFKR